MNYENLLKVKENADEEETRMNFLNLIQGAAGKVKGVATLLSGLTKTQAIIAGVATVTAVGGVGTGGYFLYDHFHQPEPIVADVVISTEVAEEPTECLRPYLSGRRRPRRICPISSPICF